MSEAYIPFLKYLVLQLAVGIIGLNTIRDREIDFSGLLKCWIFGQMICFAVLQVMAVPMILLRWQFKVLFWSYLGVMAVVFGFGVWSIKGRKRKSRLEKREWTWLAITLVIITIILIFWQSGNYFFGMHLDEDDARWLAEANDALETGHMMTVDFDTGEFIASFKQYKDAVSPWPMYWAVVSKILNLRPSVFAHTLYPPIGLFLLYGVYWLLGCELFDKFESRVVFLFSVVVINLFFGGTVYTQSVFSLIRIWQGKATVAGIITPLIVYTCTCIHKRNIVRDWVTLILVGCSACLFSGMGITISGIMIGVYGLYDVIAFQRWKRMPLLIVSLLPTAIFAILSHLLREVI